MTVPQFPSWISIPSPNFHPGRKPGIPIKGLIIHYTAAGSGKGSAEYFSKREVSWTENGVLKTAKVQAAAQLVIDRDGTVYQCTDLNDRAWHAGPATLWQGKTLAKGQNVNDWTIGIEIANWGQLQRPKLDHELVNYMGKPYKGPPPFVDSSHPGTLTYWEPYPEAQVVAVIKAAKLLVNLYPAIVRGNVFGHKDVQPVNKIDPGPAWPMERFLDEVFGDDDALKDGLNAFEDDNRAGHYDEAAEMCLVEPKAELQPKIEAETTVEVSASKKKSAPKK